jgi:hypothetical protein
VGGLRLKIELLPSVWLAAPFTGIMVSAGQIFRPHVAMRL